MERLTIPDKKVEGGWERAVIDPQEVKKHAMTIYWALKKYEDTGLTPEQIRQIDDLYAKKCREVAELRERDTAKEPAAVKRPEWKDRMLHTFLGGRTYD